MSDTYLDRLIDEHLVASQENRKPSGKLSASKLYWPLQWQILSTKFGLRQELDPYTLRKFQRGHDVEEWLVRVIKPVEVQKFFEYRGVIGYCDTIVDTRDWDNPVGLIPLEVKSVTNMKFKRVEDQADHGHVLQNAFYGLAGNYKHHAIVYVASDDYRVSVSIHEVEESRKEIDDIITRFDEAMKLETIPVFEPIEQWQASVKYNNFPEFATMTEDQLKEKYQQLINQ